MTLTLPLGPGKIGTVLEDALLKLKAKGYKGRDRTAAGFIRIAVEERLARIGFKVYEPEPIKLKQWLKQFLEKWDGVPVQVLPDRQWRGKPKEPAAKKARAAKPPKIPLWQQKPASAPDECLQCRKSPEGKGGHGCPWDCEWFEDLMAALDDDSEEEADDDAEAL